MIIESRKQAILHMTALNLRMKKQGIDELARYPVFCAHLSDNQEMYNKLPKQEVLDLALRIFTLQEVVPLNDVSHTYQTLEGET